MTVKCMLNDLKMALSGIAYGTAVLAAFYNGFSFIGN